MKKAVFLAVLLCNIIAVNAQSKVYGNKFFKEETKTLHSVALNIGYNCINNNYWNLYGNATGLPVGISYEIDKNNLWYGKLKYTNFSFTSATETGVITEGIYKDCPYTTEGSLSQHLMSVTLGRINSNSFFNRFYAGITVGFLMTMENTDTKIPYYDDGKLKEMKTSSSENSNDMYLGLDAVYKHYFNDNLFLGVEVNGGYLISKEDIAYSISGVIGWTFTKKKNYRF